MSPSELLYYEISAQLPEVKEGKMFGALCIKAQNGKALAMLWNNDMIFKLEGSSLMEALSLDGAKLFDPMGGRPMKGSYDYADRWLEFARKANEYVASIKI